MSPAMLIRALQVLAIVITAAIMWGVKQAFLSAADWGGPNFVNGFLAGGFFVFAVLGLIMWIDPASRPRGRSSEQQSPHDGI